MFEGTQNSYIRKFARSRAVDARLLCGTAGTEQTIKHVFKHDTSATAYTFMTTCTHKKMSACYQIQPANIFFVFTVIL